MNNVIKISLPDPSGNNTPEPNDGPLLLNSAPIAPVDNTTVIVGEPFTYKGASEVILDLSGVSEQEKRVIGIVIDWGDNSPREYYNKKIIFDYRENSIIEEVTRGFLGGSILDSFSHTFTPADTHINNITIQALLTYENGVDVIIKQPLTIVQESYYDNIKEFNIANIAVQDDTLSTMANLQSKHTNWTWPAYFTQESDIGDEVPQDNPFEIFDCDRAFESVDVIKDIITEGPYLPGMTIVYNVSVVNEQSIALNGCTLTDTLEGIRFNDSESADFGTGNGILPRGSTTVISYSYDITNDDTGVIENIATINSPALRNPVNSNLVSINVVQNLGIVKEAPGSIIAAAGEFVTYTVTATNPNGIPATNVRLFDSLPGVENNVVTGDADLFTGTTIPAGGSKAVTYQYQLQSSDVGSGSLVNVARLSGDGYAFVEDSATTSLIPLQDLQVTKSIVGGTLQVDSAVQYTVVATNPNSVPITNAKITDSLSEITVVGGDASLFTGTTIPSNSSISVTYEYTIPPSYIGETEIVNTVSLSGDGLATVTDTATGTLQELPVFKFIIDTTKQFEAPGDQIDYGAPVKVVNLPHMNTGESIFDWAVDTGTSQTNTNQFQLPLVANGVYDFYVYWGDGTSNKITQYDDTNTLHTYTTPGVKEITIYGQVEGWQFNNSGDRLKYIDTLEWTALTISTNAAFFGCENYTGAAGVNVIGAPTITTTDGSKMFKQCINFNGKVDNWNTSSIQNMNRFFELCCNFNQPVNAWAQQVGNVTDMQFMFAWCTSFNQPLNIWNVSSVQKFAYMFLDCRTFNRALNAWDISGLNGDMTSMFAGCWIFNRDLNSWSPWISGTTKTDSMFKRAFAFNGNVSDWDVSNVTTFNQMFATDVSPYGVFNRDISGWQPSSAVNLQLMFWGQHQFDVDISSWAQYLNNITITAGMFLDAESFNQNLDTWGPKISSVTDISSMFSSAKSFNNGDVAGSSNFPLTSWNTSRVVNMGNTFSSGSDAAGVFNQSVNSWDVRNVTNMGEMFHRTLAFNQNLDNWSQQVSGVENIERMFAGTTFNNGDVFAGTSYPMNWNVSNVTNMTGVFQNNNWFNQDISSWDTRLVTTVSSMFESTSAFNRPLNTWGEKLSGVENMSRMFAGARGFNQNISNWNTGSVTNMNSMFYNTFSYNQPVGNWNISNVTDMREMFGVFGEYWTGPEGQAPRSSLSTANYDNLLINWAQQTVQPNVKLTVIRKRTSSSDSAYTTLTTSPNNWTITDVSN